MFCPFLGPLCLVLIFIDCLWLSDLFFRCPISFLGPMRPPAFPPSVCPLHPMLDALGILLPSSNEHRCGHPTLPLAFSSSSLSSFAAHLTCCCLLPCVLLFCSPSRPGARPAGFLPIGISIVICPGPVVGLCRLRPGRAPGPSSRAGFPLPPPVPEVVCL